MLRILFIEKDKNTKTLNVRHLLTDILTILTGKNFREKYFTEISTIIHWNTRLVASDVFHMSTQSNKFF